MKKFLNYSAAYIERLRSQVIAFNISYMSSVTCDMRWVQMKTLPYRLVPLSDNAQCRYHQ